MLKLEWNALRPGDHVLVHDDLDPMLTLVPGEVAMIDTARGHVDVAIRIWPSGERSRVTRPRRHAVHFGTTAGGDCWRCALKSTAPHSRVDATPQVASASAT